jgi:hypothetical protein
VKVVCIWLAGFAIVAVAQLIVSLRHAMSRIHKVVKLVRWVTVDAQNSQDVVGIPHKAPRGALVKITTTLLDAECANLVGIIVPVGRRH